MISVLGDCNRLNVLHLAVPIGVNEPFKSNLIYSKNLFEAYNDIETSGVHDWTFFILKRLLPLLVLNFILSFDQVLWQPRTDKNLLKFLGFDIKIASLAFWWIRRKIRYTNINRRRFDHIFNAPLNSFERLDHAGHPALKLIMTSNTNNLCGVSICEDSDNLFAVHYLQLGGVDQLKGFVVASNAKSRYLGWIAVRKMQGGFIHFNSKRYLV